MTPTYNKLLWQCDCPVLWQTVIFYLIQKFIELPFQTPAVSTLSLPQLCSDD